MQQLSRVDALVHNPAAYTCTDTNGETWSSLDGVQVGAVQALFPGCDWRNCERCVLSRFNRFLAEQYLRVKQVGLGVRDPVSNELLIADLVLTDNTGDHVVIACIVCTGPGYKLSKKVALGHMSKIRDVVWTSYGLFTQCVLLVFNSAGALTVLSA